MRGRFTTWTRIRVNLQHVPEALRPPQEALDPDDAPRNRGLTARAARAEDLLELVRRRDLELIVAAVLLCRHSSSRRCRRRISCTGYDEAAGRCQASFGQIDWAVESALHAVDLPDFACQRDDVGRVLDELHRRGQVQTIRHHRERTVMVHAEERAGIGQRRRSRRSAAEFTL